MKNNKLTLFKDKTIREPFESKVVMKPSLSHAITIHKELAPQHTHLIIGCGHDLKHQHIAHDNENFYTMGMDFKPDLEANFWHTETQQYLQSKKFELIAFESTPWITNDIQKMIASTLALLAKESALVITGIEFSKSGLLNDALLKYYDSYQLLQFHKDPIRCPEIKSCTIIAATTKAYQNVQTAAYIRAVIQEKVYPENYINFLKGKGLSPLITKEEIHTISPTFTP